MNFYIGFLADLIGNPLTVLFVIMSGTIGYLYIYSKHQKEKNAILQMQIDKLKSRTRELTTQYHLLDSHTILLSHLVEGEIGRELSIQGPQGNWRTRRPLNGA